MARRMGTRGAEMALRRTWSERLRGVREVLKEVWSQTMGKLGIILVVALVVISVYAITTMPPDFVDKWTYNMKYWEGNPELAEPAWVSVFGAPTAPHVAKVYDSPTASGISILNFTLPGTGTTILRAGYVQNYTLTYELKEPQFPKGLLIKYLVINPGNVSGRALHVTPYVFVTRPDGITVLVNRPQTVTVKALAERGVERYDANILADQFVSIFSEQNLTRERAQGMAIKLLFGRMVNGAVEPLQGTYKITVVLLYSAPGVRMQTLMEQIEQNRLGVQELEIIVQGSAYGYMGTDDKGRDLYLGLLYGFPVALLIGFFAAVSSVIIGLIAGVVSGYYGGWVDELIQRTVDVIGNIPLLPILVLIGVALQAMDVSPWYRLFVIIGVLVVLGWGGLAIIVRSMTLSIKAEPYIDAARGDRRLQREDNIPSYYTTDSAICYGNAGVLGAKRHLDRGRSQCARHTARPTNMG
ncbi:ABC transporter permease [Hyperthermus butylicus]|uniref:ABC transporter permease n=1 Tax=Hyperthermus butylicus TaxID=54248 RepID=UPI00068A8B3A|nr:ABC transporter permease [Hyperthermus butylicus]